MPSSRTIVVLALAAMLSAALAVPTISKSMVEQFDSILLNNPIRISMSILLVYTPRLATFADDHVSLDQWQGLGDNTKWIFSKSSAGNYLIQNVGNLHFLESNSTTERHPEVFARPRQPGNMNQEWSVVYQPNELIFSLINVGSNQALDAEGYSYAPIKVYLNDHEADNFHQKWRWTPIWN